MILPGNPKMFLAVIAGNIGAGKSTTLRALKQLLDGYSVCFVFEPVEEWRERGYLEEFYKTGNAFEFQLRVLYSRINAFETALDAFRIANEGKDPSLVVLDRWFCEDREFARVNLNRGAMSAKQFALYETAYSYLQKHYPSPDISIWLDVSPQTCLNRLNERGRSEEVSGITLEYLQDLNMAISGYTHVVPAEKDQPLDVSLVIVSLLLPYNVIRI